MCSLVTRRPDEKAVRVIVDEDLAEERRRGPDDTPGPRPVLMILGA
jgi:hypothetical protein